MVKECRKFSPKGCRKLVGRQSRQVKSSPGSEFRLQAVRSRVNAELQTNSPTFALFCITNPACFVVFCSFLRLFFLSRGSLGEDGRVAPKPRRRRIFPLSLCGQTSPDKIKNYQTNPFSKNRNTCKHRAFSAFAFAHAKKRTHFSLVPPQQREGPSSAQTTHRIRVNSCHSRENVFAAHPFSLKLRCDTGVLYPRWKFCFPIGLKRGMKWRTSCSFN